MDDQSVSRRRWLAAVAAGTTGAVAGCAGGSSDTPDQGTQSPTESPTATPTLTAEEEQLKDNLRIALPTDPTAGVWSVYGGVMPYYTNILEPLIWVSNQMELVPWLATDWKSTSDTTWEFTIRDGVTFHNGDTLTADHVVWSFKTILNEWSWAPGWLHVNPEGVSKLDDKTVEFETTSPFPSFPGTIAHNMVAIQHPDRNREEKEVIGTGPYQVTNREKAQRVEVQRFDDYWKGTPQMGQLEFRVITDPTTRSLALEDHEIDVAYAPPSSKIKSLAQGEKTKIRKRTSPGAMYMGMNLYRDPTSDLKLRKALNLATSQQTLVETILNNVGIPARGPIARSIYWSAHEKLPTYDRDPEKATSLVEESAYDGQKLKFYVSSENPNAKTIATALQQWYKEIGVEVGIQQFEPAAFDTAIRNGEAHLWLNLSSSNSGAADYLIYETFHSKGDVNETLYKQENTGLLNPGGRVDELITKGFQTGDKEKKEAAYEKALQIIMEDEAVVVPIVYQQYVVGAQTDVKALDLRPINEMVRWPSAKHLK